MVYRQCELKKKVLEIVYESGSKKGGTVRPSVKKITFKNVNESASAHALIKKALEERAVTVENTSSPLSKSPRSSNSASTLSIRVRKQSAAGGADSSPVSSPNRPGLTLRNKDKGAASVLASMLDGCPTRVFAGGSVVKRKLDLSSTEDMSPCLYVVQDVATVNCVAAMAAGDVLLHTLDPGSIFAPDSTFFGFVIVIVGFCVSLIVLFVPRLEDETKIKWVCDENNAQVVVREVSASMLAESKPELTCICLRWLCQELDRELLHYIEELLV